MKLRIKKLRNWAKLPVRAHRTDAGMDLFYCPPSDRILFEDVDIKPFHSTLLPSGIAIEIPPNFMAEVKNKSGIASNKSLVVGACVCDPNYSGEIMVNLHNIGHETQWIEPGQKIAQLVFVEIETDIELVESEEIYDAPTERAEGGFGSTGEK